MKTSQSLILSDFVVILEIGEARGDDIKKRNLICRAPSTRTALFSQGERLLHPGVPATIPSLRAVDAALPGTGRLSHTPAGRRPRASHLQFLSCLCLVPSPSPEHGLTRCVCLCRTQTRILGCGAVSTETTPRLQRQNSSPRTLGAKAVCVLVL